MGHRKLETPLKADNYISNGISNSRVKQKRTKAMYVRFYWVQDRVKQGHFNIFWKLGTLCRSYRLCFWKGCVILALVEAVKVDQILEGKTKARLLGQTHTGLKTGILKTTVQLNSFANKYLDQNKRARHTSPIILIISRLAWKWLYPSLSVSSFQSPKTFISS